MTSYQGAAKGEGLRVGIVWSRFNEEIVRALLTACDRELVALGVSPDDIDVVSVPGALEIPVALQTLALQKRAFGQRYDALVALGAVIRGETYHFEVVANESARGILDVQLETGVPVANAVLTTNDEAQALARASVKGAEAAQVAIEMANLLRDVSARGRPGGAPANSPCRRSMPGCCRAGPQPMSCTTPSSSRGSRRAMRISCVRS
jgi:6,7-dimethyl-8-ribityllumazine synthase